MYFCEISPEREEILIGKERAGYAASMLTRIE